MIIGVPKEIKNNENRVSIVPDGVRELVARGHDVLIERSAGIGSGISDEEYVKSGARIIRNAEEVWRLARLIVKVKEPLPQEYGFIRADHVIFTYFHFASDKGLTQQMMKAFTTCIAYETVGVGDDLPLLRPMSEVAGRMSALIGGFYLAKPLGGYGVLVSGATGVEPAKFVVLGGGTVGINAAEVALRLGAKVTIVQRKGRTYDMLEEVKMKGGIDCNDFTLIESNPENIARELRETDVAIGAALVTGAKAPKLVTREMVRGMKKGAVIVDVAIDQGGVFETSKPTTHSMPVYVDEGVIHYAVTNMPGAYSRTSTFALTSATLPFVIKLADRALGALKSDKELLNGLNIYKGRITNKGVADAFGMEYADPSKLLE